MKENRGIPFCSLPQSRLIFSLRSVFLVVALFSGIAMPASGADIFDKSNLAAWCIVPYDGKKRGPEERAAMLKKLGITKFVYDYRPEHIPQWDEELTALKKHDIELLGWWFPTVFNDRASEILELFQRHDLKPQLWVSGSGKESVKAENEADQQARIAREIARLAPICEAAAPQGLTVGLYNHGGWFGEPENQIAILKSLKSRGIDNVGIVYNLHHGHSHLDFFPKVLEAMKQHLICLNLNGMDIGGDQMGRKILPLGIGTEDVEMIRQIRVSGYDGPIGILNHTNEDAEGRLLDNIDGLNWILSQLDGNKPESKPDYRTWIESENISKTVEAASGPPATRKATGVPSIRETFGKALSGGLSLAGNPDYHALPFTIECRAKLDRKERFNILVACNPKKADTHWELYTLAKRGTLALYMPGRGGDYRSEIDICDGEWHDLVASVDEAQVKLWVDGKLVLERRTGQLPEIVRHAGVESYAVGRLVEGTIGCDGLIDDVRISRGVLEPQLSDSPREREGSTLGLWNFDDLPAVTSVAEAPAPVPFTPNLAPLNPEDYEHRDAFVNRERVFDFYGKQALHFRKQSPPPELISAFPGLDGGQQGHWGNQNDADTWVDDRWSKSDLGSVFCGVFKGANLRIPKSVCVRYDNLAAVFDPTRLMFPVIWEGGFVRLNDRRRGFMVGAPMDGTVVAKSEQQREGRYLGFYRHGKEVVFAYENEDGRQLLNVRGDGREALAPLTLGGPPQWPEWIKTRGETGTGQPFATDRLTLPIENPYGTVFYLTAHDFFDDGSAAVCTMTGEVWLVRGIDETLETLRWKRFASGLHQPLGMKIVDGKVHVIGRDQITCLHDLNGDDETDYYECVTNAMETSIGGHNFVVGLEQNLEGRWIYTSGNEGLCRISADNSVEVLATGFRNPNGLAMSPDGRFLTTSGQEGVWTPASSVFQVELGRNEGAHFGAGGPKDGQDPEPPLLYLPRGEDNSSSSQAFISGEKWAPLAGDGNLVHLSSGGASAWLVMREQVNDRWQAATMKITGNFDSGPQCARFHPLDGQLYVSGLLGWGNYAPIDGCFQRVRFTGGSPVPVGFETRENGILIRFDQPFPASAASPDETFAQCWNYRYSAAYGSPEFSLRYPDTPGHDPLAIRGLHRLEKGCALFVEIPQLTPANQVHLRLATGQDFFLTLHELGEPFTAFPGYTAIEKAKPAVPSNALVPEASEPNPWAAGKAGREIRVEAESGLQFVQKELRAKAGERISLTFVNPDVLPHNWILTQPGSLQRVGELANLMITDPQGLARHYVPGSDEVLVWTDMVNPNEEATIYFDVPDKPGDYPYLCTFPGHWMIMNGVLKVE